MPWKVRSSIVGGRSLSVAKSQAYSSEARKLCSLANELSSLGASWQHAAMIIAQQTSVFQRSANKTVWQYESSPFAKQASRCALTSNMCTHYARKCQHLSQRLQELASLIVRANSLYGDAELRAKENFDNQIALLTSVMPLHLYHFLLELHSLHWMMQNSILDLNMLLNGHMQLNQYNKELFVG